MDQLKSRCKKCGAELTTLRFPIGYSVTCPVAECRGNGDDLIYYLTPEAAEKHFKERRKPK
jgi:hypothetical protein